MDNQKSNIQIQSRIVTFGKPKDQQVNPAQQSQQSTFKPTNDLTDAEIQRQLSLKDDQKQLSPAKQSPQPQQQQQQTKFEEEKNVIMQSQPPQPQLFYGIKIQKLIGKGSRGNGVYQGLIYNNQKAIKIINHLSQEESQQIMFNINKARPFEQFDKVLKIIDIQVYDNPTLHTTDILIIQDQLQSFQTCEPNKGAIVYALQLAELIEKLHSQNVFIGAIKPSNIFYDAKSVYLSDLGFSPFFDMKYIEQHSGYLAPESFNQKIFDKRSDIWSFGMVMLTSFFHKIREPWQFILENKLYFGKNLDLDLKPLGSRDCRKLIENMIKYEPEKRITIADVIKNLKELQKDLLKK